MTMLLILELVIVLAAIAGTRVLRRRSDAAWQMRLVAQRWEQWSVQIGVIIINTEGFEQAMRSAQAALDKLNALAETAHTR